MGLAYPIRVNKKNNNCSLNDETWLAHSANLGSGCRYKTDPSHLRHRGFSQVKKTANLELLRVRYK